MTFHFLSPSRIRSASAYSRRSRASFDPIWRELFPREQARILRLLIETVTYDAEADEVAITFRPGGIKMVAEENARETA